MVIAMGEFFFRPTVVRASAGDTLSVTLRNEGQNVHNFEIPGQRIDLTLAEGQEQVVRVLVPEAGGLTFQCKFHLPRRMRGEFRTDAGS